MNDVSDGLLLLFQLQSLQFDMKLAQNLGPHCINRPDKSTCTLSYSCKWCVRIDLLNRMVHAARTFAVLPCHNLKKID